MADAAENVIVHIEDGGDTTRIDPETGTIETDQPDGSVVVQLDAHRPKPDGDDDDGDKFYENLALTVPGMDLATIANDLYDAIESDNQSRQQYLQIRARGLDLLGLKLEEPKSTVGDSTSGVEGMSSVTNPLLLEAILKGWANARAELLPAEGPCKISVEGDETTSEDDLAEALERDMNWQLTKGMPEYYPDTSHMLLWGTYFGGSGFKKVYRCPMRRRPVSESVDVKDLIVSDTTKDLRSCGRITHEITMRPSVMKRMMKLGTYRDVTLTQPSPQPNAVESKIDRIQGTTQQNRRPEDQSHTLWECQCELDLPEGFDHPSMSGSTFKETGIPLPYLVTLDKDSREILSLRRDWKEDDAECERCQMYVKYPYVPGPGFYGTGMLNILGNLAAAMTAVDRESLDAGMFASFPGGLISKIAGRQNTSNFRVGCGEFAPVETNGQPIQSVVMAMPYKDPSPGLMALRDKLVAQAKELGGAVEIPASEGLQNVPVGTMLAQIEQNTKVMLAAHKDMCQAQGEEFDLIIELYRQHPEDFWRKFAKNKKCPKDYWNEEKLLRALDDCHLVPRADPNTPSHLHRVMKALAWVQLIAIPQFGPYLSIKEILMRVVHAMREDPTGAIIDPPPQAAQAPPLADEAKMLDAQAKVKSADVNALKAQTDATTKGAELASQEKIEQTRLQREEVIHQGDQINQGRELALKVKDQGLAERAQSLDESKHALDTGKAHHEAALNTAQAAHDAHMDLNPVPQPAKPGTEGK